MMQLLDRELVTDPATESAQASAPLFKSLGELRAGQERPETMKGRLLRGAVTAILTLLVVGGMYLMIMLIE